MSKQRYDIWIRDVHVEYDTCSVMDFTRDLAWSEVADFLRESGDWEFYVVPHGKQPYVIEDNCKMYTHDLIMQGTCFGDKTRDSYVLQHQIHVFMSRVSETWDLDQRALRALYRECEPNEEN